jgi:flagellar protein FlaG
MHPQHPQPSVELVNGPDFRDGYANSVQLRVSLWDFYLLFGNIQQDSRPGHVAIRNFQGIYLSPQQAKALMNVLQQNVQQYESAFGEIRLEQKGEANIVQ